jgi:hypothetical protein
MTGTEEIMIEIEAFLKRTGMAPSTFGRKSCGDGHAVSKLRNGLGMSMLRAKKIRRFMADVDSGRIAIDARPIIKRRKRARRPCTETCG